MMLSDMRRIETMARLSMGDHWAQEQLPKRPARGPFAYFRLGIIVLAILVAALWLLGAM